MLIEELYLCGVSVFRHCISLFFFYDSRGACTFVKPVKTIVIAEMNRSVPACLKISNFKNSKNLGHGGFVALLQADRPDAIIKRSAHLCFSQEAYSTTVRRVTLNEPFNRK